MNITVNGAAQSIATRTLQQTLIELGYGGMAIATALNGEIVHREQRSETVLKEGDALEVVAPMAGG